jgi:hypothetical protein
MTSAETVLVIGLAVVVILNVFLRFFMEWEQDRDFNDGPLPSCKPCKKDCRQGRDCPYRK